MNRLLCNITILLCVFSFSVISCQKAPVYTAYKDLNASMWYGSDTVLFSMPKYIGDIDGELSLGVRYTSEYEYRNLALCMSLYEDKILVRRDTLRYVLFSDCDEAVGSGAYFRDEQLNVGQVTMRHGHRYSVRVHHLMRKDPIVGIKNIFVNFK